MSRQLDDLLLIDEDEIYAEAQRRIRECREKGGRKLDFSCLRLTKIPPEIAELETLVELDISNISMKKLPAFLGKLVSLKRLSIGSVPGDKNKGLILPPQLGNLRNLQNLTLDFGISEIPKWVFALDKLQELNIFNDTITTIPAEIANLSKLRKLRVYGANISSLPREIGELSNLSVFGTGCPELKSLPESFARLIKMQSIRVENCNLAAIPDYICAWADLEEIEMEKTFIFPDSKIIKTIPRNIGKLKKLRSLVLHGADIEKIPDSIGSCPLQYLYISGSFTTVPASIGNLSNLKKLHLSSEKLTSLPDSFCKLKKLEELSLVTFALKSLPAAFGNLRALKIVDIFSGAMTELPESMGSLKNLKSLNIDAYNVKQIPSSFHLLSYLKEQNIQLGSEALLPPNTDSEKKRGTIGFGDIAAMGHRYQWKFLETRSLKQLESLLISAPRRLSDSQEKKDVFKRIMLERGQRLNKNFKWTNENKKRMVKVSDAFLQAWEDGLTKAKKMVKTLHPRDDEYTVEIILYPEINFENESAKWELYNTITYYLNPEMELSMRFHYKTPTKNGGEFRKDIHISRKLSWNIEGLGDIELADSYICYALHILYSHNEWAFEDILKVNNISTEIRITRDSEKF